MIIFPNYTVIFSVFTLKHILNLINLINTFILGYYYIIILQFIKHNNCEVCLSCFKSHFCVRPITSSVTTLPASHWLNTPILLKFVSIRHSGTILLLVRFMICTTLFNDYIYMLCIISDLVYIRNAPCTGTCCPQLSGYCWNDWQHLLLGGCPV